jgi:glycosyltransferase involved in cell wall biosynthesis
VNVLDITTHIGLSRPKNGAQERHPNLAGQLTARDASVIVLEAAEFVDRQDALATIYSYTDLKFAGQKLHVFRDLAHRLRTVNSKVFFLMGGTGAPTFKRENVYSVGFVENLQRSLAAGDIATVPLRAGSGTWLKIFQYMRKGLPVVTTENGIDGASAHSGEHARTAPRVYERFVDKVAYPLENESERARSGANTRKLLEAKHTLDAIGVQLLVVRKFVLGGRHGS